jgi:hypothetical protein
MAISWADDVANANVVMARKAISRFIYRGFIAVVKVHCAKRAGSKSNSWRKINNYSAEMVAT